jgi:hypothetical protein
MASGQGRDTITIETEGATKLPQVQVEVQGFDESCKPVASCPPADKAPPTRKKR